MSSNNQAVSIQECKHCGSGAPVDAHFCPQCEKILTLVRHGDYFRFLGLPRKLAIDVRDLDDRLRALSRQFHPDYYTNATPGERLASLERSSYLNDAYRTLKNPVSRVEYLLKVEGIAAAATREARAAAPAGLLEEVFEFNEQVDAIREAREAGESLPDVDARITRARGFLELRRAAHGQRFHTIAAEWDRLVEGGAPRDQARPTLTALRDWFLEETYIANMTATLEREAAEQV